MGGRIAAGPQRLPTEAVAAAPCLEFGHGAIEAGMLGAWAARRRRVAGAQTLGTGCA